MSEHRLERNAGMVDEQELEALLREAERDPAKMLRFYRSFLEATVWIAGVRRGEAIEPTGTGTVDGVQGIAVFTSKQRCERFGDPPACHGMSAVSLLASLPPLVNVYLDADDPEHKLIVSHLVVRALLSGAMFSVDETTFDGQFLCGVLTEPEGKLKRVLRSVLAKHPDVDAAYMTQLYEPASMYPPQPAVGVHAPQEALKPAIEDCIAAADAIGRRITAYEMRPDGFPLYAHHNSVPFFRRTPEPKIAASALARDDLLAYLRAAPDDAWFSAGSLLGGLLQSGTDEEEARKMWKSGVRGPRSDSFDRFLEYYKETKAWELSRLRSQSTHSEARRVLIDALEGDGRFCVYLRDFASEAIQYLDPDPRTGLFHVKWFGLQPRTIDEPVEKMIKALRFPTVGAVNAGRVVSFTPPPVPLLALADDAWAGVIGGMIAQAEMVIVVPGSSGRGLGDELMAIQDLEREDETVIFIEDEGDAKARYEDIAGLIEALPIPDDLRPRPPQPVMRNRLAGLGRLVTPAILSEIAARYGLNEDSAGSPGD